MNDFVLGKIILDWAELFKLRGNWKEENLKIVFTNGVFDLLHRGHLDYLIESRHAGDILVVGVNSDDSVKRLKGPKRPLVKQTDRIFMLSCLRPVDYVTLFDQDTPLELISQLKPDILVKGDDYAEKEIVGAEEVKQNGGEVKRIPITKNRSSSLLINNILLRYQED